MNALEKLTSKATLPPRQEKERAESEINSISLVAQNLFGVERLARQSLEARVDRTRAQTKFAEHGWRTLDTTCLGWTRGFINPVPTFAMFRIDDSQMVINANKVERPHEFPSALREAYRPALQFTRGNKLTMTFRGVLPEETKEKITKIAPLFTAPGQNMAMIPHLYLVCEANLNKTTTKPQEFVLVGWDQTHLWLIEDEKVQSMTVDKFIDFKFPEFTAPEFLSLPEYNPYGGTE